LSLAQRRENFLSRATVASLNRSRCARNGIIELRALIVVQLVALVVHCEVEHCAFRKVSRDVQQKATVFDSCT
jgi:hypothetical protein